MADHLLRDRQDIPIWNAIEANNFKQALKLVDKRLAKKQTDYLEIVDLSSQALKIYIRSRSPLVSEKSAVLVHLEELTGRKPPITELDAIDLYDEAWEEILPKSRGDWGKTIGELRWQCVKASPKDEELATKCFQQCLSNGDLDHARQISNSLEKAFPNSHAYVFWNISAMFLFSISNDCPENQKKIWGGLAFGQISKLAIATKEAADPTKLPVRAIHSPQELLLLHRITEEYGKPEKRLEYLNDPMLGPESAVAKGEWQLWRFRLKILRSARQWQELFDISSVLLQKARTKDSAGNIMEPGMSDWIVWEAYISSAVELPGHKQKSAVLAEIEAHLDPASGIDKSWRRNASLAWVKFCFETATQFSVIPAAEGKGQIMNHIPIVIKYLQKFGNASTAYNDLRPYVERLDLEERSQLLGLLLNHIIFEAAENTLGKSSEQEENKGPLGENLSTANSITQAINTYKLRYLLTSALPEHERRRSPLCKPGVTQLTCTACSKPCGQICVACVTSLAKDSIRSYKTAIEDDGGITKSLLSTDRHPADDFCVLAAMCLFKLALAETESASEPLSTPKTSHILQATALLEYGYTRSKSNFQISILLVRLYTYLGSGSLALRSYQRLNLKQIQLDTLSFTMFDRISTQHPHPFSHTPDDDTSIKSPADFFGKQHKLYRGARGQISKNMWTSFKQGNFNSIFEVREVSETLSRTLSGAMSVIESKRIARLTKPDMPLTGTSAGDDILPPNAGSVGTAFIDTNDYDSFPNYESSQGARFETLSRCTPGPSEYRYRAHLAAEKLTQLVAPVSQPDGEIIVLQSWLNDHVDSIASISGGSDGMTEHEQLSNQIYNDIAVIIREACDKARWSEEGFESELKSRNQSLLQSLEKYTSLISSIQDLVPAFSTTLHALYTGHEAARTTLHFSTYLSKLSKNAHEYQTDIIRQSAELAHELAQIISTKSATIKKGLDEGGWIDKVLESTFPEVEEENRATTMTTTNAMNELIDENFMEEWAGLLVESWRESTIGLAFLKPLK